MHPHLSPVADRTIYPPRHTFVSRMASIAIVCVLLEFPAFLLLGITHPRVPMAVPILLIALPMSGLICGIIAVLANRRLKDPRVKRARHGMTIGAVILVLVLGVAILLPSLCRSGEQANRVKCSTNLRQIGLATLTYAGAHNGQFPPSLDVLLAEGDLSADAFVCPSGEDERATGANPQEVMQKLRTEPHHMSYVYVGAGLTNTSPAEAIVAYEQNSKNHRGDGIHVLYADGHAEFQTRKVAARIMAELTAGHNPPRWNDDTTQSPDHD